MLPVLSKLAVLGGGGVLEAVILKVGKCAAVPLVAHASVAVVFLRLFAKEILLLLVLWFGVDELDTLEPKVVLDKPPAVGDRVPRDVVEDGDVDGKDGKDEQDDEAPGGRDGVAAVQVDQHVRVEDLDHVSQRVVIASKEWIEACSEEEEE